MDERDFYRGLKEDRPEDFSEAAEFFLAQKKRSRHAEPEDQPVEPEKTAGLLEHLPGDLKNPRLLTAGGLGAAALGAGTYLASKPQESLGGRSKAEADFDEILARNQARSEEGAGFGQKVKHRLDEFGAGLSRTFREHPGAAAATLGVPIGAAAGIAGGKMLGAASEAGKSILQHLRSPR
jgi:hypothetical protein